MRQIKIFLASSEELIDDRLVFGDLIRKLGTAYEKRGISLKLLVWDDFDAALSKGRKQDEYNALARDSDMFVALFHRKAGDKTLEELDVAMKAFEEKESPKVYVFLKNLQPGETASPELEELKHRLKDIKDHYWCRYNNRESLRFQFVMQLLLVDGEIGDGLNVEGNEVRLDGLKVVSMDDLEFASANEE